MRPICNHFNDRPYVCVRRLIPHCLLFSMVLVWAGCNQEAKVGSAINAPVAAEVNPVGTYALVTINGNKVPCAIEHEGHTLEIKSGSFIIDPDGACRSKMFLSGRDSAIETKAASTRQGTKLTMQWEGAGMTTGTITGDTFTMENEGMILVYRK